MIMITNFVKEVSEFRNFLHETKEYIFGCIFRQRILWIANFLKPIDYILIIQMEVVSAVAYPKKAFSKQRQNYSLKKSLKYISFTKHQRLIIDSKMKNNLKEWKLKADKKSQFFINFSSTHQEASFKSLHWTWIVTGGELVTFYLHLTLPSNAKYFSRSSVIICFCNGKKRFSNHSFSLIQFCIIPLRFYFVKFFDAGQLWRALFILNCFLSWSSLCETPQALNYKTCHHDYITKGLKDLNGFEFGFEIKIDTNLVSTGLNRCP